MLPTVKSLILATTLALTQIAAVAAPPIEYVEARKIIDLGCHNVDGTCFVTLQGAPFGSTLACASGATSQFRFDNGDTAIGRRSYASFLAAYLSGRAISVAVQGCTGQGVPALYYFHVLS